MKIFKNKIGRPSNKTLAKRRIILSLIIIVILSLCFIVSSIFIIPSINNMKLKANINTKKKIVVIFHRNSFDNDNYTLKQSFTYGESNRFWYNEGKKINVWENNDKKIVGWSFNKKSEKINYKTYSNVTNYWFNNVYNKEYKTQLKNGEVHLYAVWKPKFIKVIFHRNLNKSDDKIVTQNFIINRNAKKFLYKNNQKMNLSWKKSGYELSGWALNQKNKKANYPIYSYVSYDWMNNVYNKRYKTQLKKGEIHLYAVWKQKVDLALFWGQSNMVGYSINCLNSDVNYKNYNRKDINGLIDNDIIKGYNGNDYVSVNLENNMGFEFGINSKGSGQLTEINSKTKYVGQDLLYYNGGLKRYSKSSSYNSIQKSRSTNTIPQFIKTYTKITGNKLIVVFGANAGEMIKNFLPNGKNERDEKYIYEAIRKKYSLAKNYLNNNGYAIKNQFYVAFQGCSDNIKSNYKNNNYYNTFMKVHNNIKKDLGIPFGAIIETGGDLYKASFGSSKKDYIQYAKYIHTQQEALINNNNDIILGTKFSYNIFNKQQINAFCIQQYEQKAAIHLTSASLAQIGKESAESVSKRIISNK